MINIGRLHGASEEKNMLTLGELRGKKVFIHLIQEKQHELKKPSGNEKRSRR